MMVVFPVYNFILSFSYFKRKRLVQGKRKTKGVMYSIALLDKSQVEKHLHNGLLGLFNNILI